MTPPSTASCKVSSKKAINLPASPNARTCKKTMARNANPAEAMSATQSWLIVLALAVGTFLIRYSFIGLFANRDMPPWLNRAL